jgi:hypothetical protein
MRSSAQSRGTTVRAFEFRATYSCPHCISRYYLVTSGLVVSAMAEILGATAASLELARAIHGIVDFAKAVKNGPSQLTDLLQEIVILDIAVKSIATCADSTPKDHSAAIWYLCHERCATLASELLKLTEDLQHAQRRNRMAGAIRIVLKQDRIRNIQQKIEAAKATLTLVQTAHQLNQL